MNGIAAGRDGAAASARATGWRASGGYKPTGASGGSGAMGAYIGFYNWTKSDVGKNVSFALALFSLAAPPIIDKLGPLGPIIGTSVGMSAGFYQALIDCTADLGLSPSCDGDLIGIVGAPAGGAVFQMGRHVDRIDAARGAAITIFGTMMGIGGLLG